MAPQSRNRPTVGLWIISESRFSILNLMSHLLIFMFLFTQATCAGETFGWLSGSLGRFLFASPLHRSRRSDNDSRSNAHVCNKWTASLCASRAFKVWNSLFLFSLLILRYLATFKQLKLNPLVPSGLHHDRDVQPFVWPLLAVRHPFPLPLCLPNVRPQLGVRQTPWPL